ncbi:pyrroloquinoline quinone biosynthesis protein PqqE [Actinomadura opuntiae]|uniref:pyrroloquinoline quinone biosynthesis protein PqqE n=1 Tax=Actinomadura sp. OS1-43 TaxID=604315 RepID=UPI00255A7661|nr:pyrroloquinoline quinone biosynthesis protein PqqE [Actinomadura sp. OS1-43]MDL4814308.1 pyrroloquinoline quinone biosynthesis protein PqqE [Actinomadura sp. OS1-43]
MTEPAAPWALLAELTHACPLHCPYCSNPLELVRRSTELAAEEWARVFTEAADLGIVQAHLSGGEPLLRPDLEEIVAAAHRAGVYTQLVTSGLALTAERLDALAGAGINSVQLSVQDADRKNSDLIAGRTSFAAKERAAAVIRATGLPFGLNVVLHRHNLDRLPEIIELGESWGADRIELANAQFYGWALRNRDVLLPTREQFDRAKQTVAEHRERPGGPELVWVLPDYYEGVPKPCMGGWGARSITVAPDGTALPCPAAYAMTELHPPNVRDHSLAWIWQRSEAFNAYRGTAWMSGPCGDCPRREIDFGGCRCQAHALTGDASRTDPACALSPDHHLVSDPAALAGQAPGAEPEFVYRRPGGARGQGPVRPSGPRPAPVR